MEFTYDTGLVALSISAAILGSFTGLVLTSGIRSLRGRQAALRVVLGGLGIGGGIWSMHFIAMLAVELPVPLRYDIPQTIFSAVVAIGFTTLAIGVVAARRLGKLSLPLSAVLLGLAIASMHYIGMSAIRGCGLSFTVVGVVISVLIAVQASAVALWFAFRHRGVIDTLLGSAALGLAVAAMHYSAMEGTRFVPARMAENWHDALSGPVLAVVVAVTLYTVCSMCIVVFALLTFRGRMARL